MNDNLINGFLYVWYTLYGLFQTKDDQSMWSWLLNDGPTLYSERGLKTAVVTVLHQQPKFKMIISQW